MVTFLKLFGVNQARSVLQFTDIKRRLLKVNAAVSFSINMSTNFLFQTVQV
jgi:hypothetical protein